MQAVLPFLSEAQIPAISAKRYDASLLGARLASKYADRITGRWHQPASPGRYADLPPELPHGLRTALRERGIDRIYSHQAEAWDAARAGSHVLVVTPTASGKSLCYQLPMLDAAVVSGGKTLCLFPTKALAQDQMAELEALNQSGRLGLRCHTFDGDTPGDARQAVRLRGDIILSNPDMLHQAILPHHTKWAQFFEQLRFIVIDEVHTYRGVFGSHVANVLRRLQRIARFYGVSPQYLLCTATIGNPREHAEQLIGSPVHAVTDNGAPRGERLVLLWNPPVVQQELAIRASARSQTSRIARHALRAGLKTLLFANSRLMVEVLSKYLKDAFDHDPRKRKPTPSRLDVEHIAGERGSKPRLRRSIQAYRGGYLPNERRAIERAMRAGEIDGLVATSALELGVDIGSLDLVVLNGFPGSISATWQRLGRAGRRQQASLGIVVASSEALDQYLVRRPDYFFAQSPEQARIHPDQTLILFDHLRCAAFELPFTSGEHFGERNVREYLDVLVEEAVLHCQEGRYDWIADSYPATSVNLRSVADGNFVVVDSTEAKQQILAEVDYTSAALTLYEGAIYLLQAEPWQVERLDWVGRKAYVRRTHVDYYTDAIDYTRLNILDRFDQSKAGLGLCFHGEVHVLRRVTGYKKIRYYTHENIGYGRVELPDQTLHTTAVWWQLSSIELEQLFQDRQQALDGFLAAAHAIHLVARIHVMAEGQDLCLAVGDGEMASSPRQWRKQESGDGSRSFVPTVYLYDNYPGGMGLSEPMFANQQQLLDAALSVIDECSCAQGCPACIGPVSEHRERVIPSLKQLAKVLLRSLLAPSVIPATEGSHSGKCDAQ